MEWKDKTVEGVILVVFTAVAKWVISRIKKGTASFKKALLDSEKVDGIEKKILDLHERVELLEKNKHKKI